MWYTRIWMHDICGFACPQVEPEMCILQCAIFLMHTIDMRHKARQVTMHATLWSITGFSSLGDVLLVGDFNKCTRREQTALYMNPCIVN